MSSHDAFATPRFGAFTLRTECPKCGAHLPANGPSPAVTCAVCDTRVPVPAKLLRDLFEAFEAGWPSVQASDATTIGDLTWRWTRAPSAGPTCPACRAEVAPGDDSETALGCVHCGGEVSSGPVGKALASGVASVARVYGADPDALPAVAAAPVAMRCPQCGAGLTVTSTHQRLTPCGHCGTTVHIPDAVWLALHPPRTVHPWTVRFDGESRPARQARLARERAERERDKAEAAAAKRRAHEAARAEADTRRREAERRDAEAARVRAADEAARRAAAERRRRLLLSPVLAASWMGGLGSAAALVGVAAWYTWGPLTVLVPYAPRSFWVNAPRPAMLVAFGVAFVAWLLVHGARAVRLRRKVVGTVIEAAWLGMLCSFPLLSFFFGPTMAWHYLRLGPPVEEDPLTWRLPIAALALALSATWLATFAALSGIPVLGPGGMWERVLD